MADDFKSLTDEELVRMWDNEDAKNALYCRMLPTLYKLIAPFNAYGIQGYDYDDLLQEASLAFTRAVTTYNPGKNAKFRTYLWICVRSHLLNLAKHAKTDSERSINGAVSLYEPLNSENPDIKVIDTLSTESDFEENAVREQLTETILNRAEKILSMFEYTVFKKFYIENSKVSEIAKALGCSVKSVENTLYRIRTKFREAEKKTENR